MLHCLIKYRDSLRLPPCSVRTCTLVTYKFEMQALGVLVAELERQVAAAATAVLHTQALAARRVIQQRLKLHAHTHLDPHSCRCGAKEQIKCYKVHFARRSKNCVTR